jgi:hypothetical protein
VDKQLWGADPVNGRSKWVILDHYGPASYVTNGEEWPPQSTYGGPNSIGLSGLQWVNGGTSESGTYRVVPVFGGGASVKGTILLVWYVISTGLEVGARVDLSAEVIRLLAVGG